MELGWELNFRTQMKKRREAEGWSQSAMAKRVSARGLTFHQPTIQRIEDGDRPVRLDEAYVIAQVFGTKVEVMTGSSEDAEVDASAAMRRLHIFANGIATAINPHWADHDDLAEFVEALREAMDTDISAPSTRWMGAWAVHGLEVATSLAQLWRASLRFEEEWEPEWDEDENIFTDSYPISELRALLDADEWEQLPAELRPKALATVPVNELDDAFLGRSGPFAARGGDDGEHQTEA